MGELETRFGPKMPSPVSSSGKKTVAELLPLDRPFGIAGTESLILSRNFRNANAISDSLLRGLQYCSPD